jgi:hypothetical protein
MPEKNLQPIPQPDSGPFAEVLNTADLLDTILQEETPVAEPTPIVVALGRVADPERVAMQRPKETTRQTSLKRRGSGDPLISLRRANNNRRRY